MPSLGCCVATNVDFSLGSLMHLNAGVICSSYIRYLFLISAIGQWVFANAEFEFASELCMQSCCAYFLVVVIFIRHMLK